MFDTRNLNEANWSGVCFSSETPFHSLPNPSSSAHPYLLFDWWLCLVICWRRANNVIFVEISILLIFTFGSAAIVPRMFAESLNDNQVILRIFSYQTDSYFDQIKILKKEGIILKRTVNFTASHKNYFCFNPFNGSNSNCSWELFCLNAPTNNCCISKSRSSKLKILLYLLSQWIYLKIKVCCENYINLSLTVMEIFTDNFQGSKLKSFYFQNDRLCSTQTHKHHDVHWNRIFEKQQIFFDLYRCYSKKF